MKTSVTNEKAQGYGQKGMWVGVVRVRDRWRLVPNHDTIVKSRTIDELC